MDIDPVIKDVYTDMLRHRRTCSVDRILTNPVLRDEFLSRVSPRVGSGFVEEEILLRLVALRKRSLLPRSGDFRDAPAV